MPASRSFVPLHLFGGAHPFPDELQERIITGFHPDVDTRKPSFLQSLQLFPTFSCRSFRSGIGRDPPNRGEVRADERDDLRQVVGLHDKGVGILQEDGFTTRQDPRRDGSEVFVILTGERPDTLDHPAYPADLLLDLGNRAKRESLALVRMAEGASVPGAVPGHPDQETPGLTRRSYRPLFEGCTIPVQAHVFCPKQDPPPGATTASDVGEKDRLSAQGERKGIPGFIPVAHLKMHVRFIIRSPVVHVPDWFAFFVPVAASPPPVSPNHNILFYNRHRAR